MSLGVTEARLFNDVFTAPTIRVYVLTFGNGNVALYLSQRYRVHWLFVFHTAPGVSEILFPLWAPFLAAALPTAYAWYRCRRRPPGHCPKCGYDLAGNTAGVCPECGKSAGTGFPGRAGH